MKFFYCLFMMVALFFGPSAMAQQRMGRATAPPDKQTAIQSENPQRGENPQNYRGLRPLTEADKEKLRNLNEFKPRPTKASRPAAHNNAQNRWFRPIFNQQLNSCGQASGVGYNFTYEMNRLRNVTSSISDETTLYPSFYTWTQINGANNIGSWYFDGWDIIMENGCPNVKDYGMMDSGDDDTYWMSGYDKYHNAMQNRIEKYEKITVSTTSGLNNLKDWMWNHGGLTADGEGGLANFSAYTTNYTLESNAATGGKSSEWGITAGIKWGNGGAHAMTLVGYDDNVSVTLGGTTYTGAFVVANSWDTWWGSNGFAYMPYAMCSTSETAGGIQNVTDESVQAVHILYPEIKDGNKGNDFIDLTLDVTLSHSNRANCWFMIGFSSDTAATVPDNASANNYDYAYIDKFMVGDGYYGPGEVPFGGENSDATDAFNFGFDVTNFNSGSVYTKVKNITKPAKVFLTVQSNKGDGKLISASLKDYSNNMLLETPANRSGVALATGTGTAFLDNIFSFVIYPSTYKVISVPGSFTEANANDGSLNPATFSLRNMEWGKSSGTLDASTYSVSGLPMGLSVAAITINSSTSATITFSGNAVDHEASSSKNVKVEFKESAFKNISSFDNVANHSKNVKVSFINPYKMVFVDLGNTTINATNTWFSFTLSNSYFGGWYDSGNLRFETNTLNVVCSGSTRNITLLEEGTEISSSSNWVAGGAYPDEHNLYTSDFTSNAGKTGYIALEIPKGDDVYYAWVKVTVSEDGKSYILHNAAYYTGPNVPITAGGYGGETLAIISASKNKVVEDMAANNGIVTDYIEYTLQDARFAVKAGNNLTQGLHYNIEGLPSGLAATVVVVDEHTAKLYFTGKAVKHGIANTVENISVKFADAAFRNISASSIQGVSSYFTMRFFDPFQIVSGTGSTTTSSGYVEIADGKFAFYAWKNTNNDRGSFCLDTYGGALVCASETNDYAQIKVLSSGNKIKNDVEFWRTYPDYPNYYELYNASDYTSWSGKTGYVGFSFSDSDGFWYYGWFKLEVKSGASSITVTDWAYYTKPYGEITAGSTELPSAELSAVTSGTFKETYANDGALPGNCVITVSNDNFVFTPDVPLTSDKFSVTGVPAGIEVKITPLDMLNLKVEMVGTATNHTTDYNGTINIVLNASCLENNTTSSLKNLKFNFEFKGPFQIIYSEQGTTVSSSSTWEWFWVGCNDFYSDYGAWYTSGLLRLETYGNYVAGTTGSQQLAPISAGTIIGENTNWVCKSTSDGTDYFQLYSSSEGFTSWSGKTAYIGIAIQNGDYWHYGWMQVKVASGGSSYEVIDWAYNDEPFRSIAAGSKVQTSVKPTPYFYANMTSVKEGGSVAFTDQSVDAPTSYSWTFEGGTPSTSSVQNPVVTYANKGTYDVSLVVSNASGSNTLTKTDYITVTAGGEVQMTGPVAAFAASATEVNAGSSVTFTNKSANATSYAWTFTGGTPSTSTSANPVVTYSAAGTYSVTLVATNAYGNHTETRSNYIKVNPMQDPATGYCAGTTFSSDYAGGYIISVVFANLNNVTDACSDKNYGDFTSQTAQLVAGETYKFTLTSSGGTDTYKSDVWIDWNGTGTWEEEERTSLTNFTADITVPNNAVGAKRVRMRVNINAYNSLADACASGYFGETEDYSVLISAPIVAQPDVNFMASSVSVEKNTSVVLSTISNSELTNISWSVSPSTGVSGSLTGDDAEIIFANTGIYSVTLNAKVDGKTVTATRNNYITVTEPVPFYTVTFNTL